MARQILTMAAMQVLFFTLFSFIVASAEPLHLGFASIGEEGGGQNCSTTCESSFCSIPPLLKYGKYCGLDYSGCPGEPPCDGLDACCQQHDACVNFNNGDLLSHMCNENFLQCMDAFRSVDGRSFEGSTCSVAEVEAFVYHLIEAALLTGKLLGRP